MLLVVPLGFLIIQSVVCMCYRIRTNTRLERVEDRLERIVILRPGTAIEMARPLPSPPPIRVDRYIPPPPPTYLPYQAPTAPYEVPPPPYSYQEDPVPHNINAV